MSRASEFLRQIEEMSPFLDPKRKELKELGTISDVSMTADFQRLPGLTTEGFVTYENEVTKTFISGFHEDEKFHIVLRMTVQAPHLPIKPMQLQKYRQVEMVNIDLQHAHTAAAKSLYNFFASHFDLVSDRYQYQGAKTLWQSVAKDRKCHVYVYDLDVRDYFRDADGTPTKYDGKNIDSLEIWGQEPKHDERLLVASMRELK